MFAKFRFVNRIVAVTMGLLICGWHCSPAYSQDDADTLGDIAIETAEAATTAQPYPPEVQAAIDKFKAGDFLGAKSLLTTACQQNSKLSPPGVLMGTLFFQTRQPVRARAAFEEAVRDNPGDPEAYVVFGENALQQRRFTDAMLLFEKGAEVAKSYDKNPERQRNLTVRAMIGVGAVAEARGDYAKSETALKAALALDATSVAAMSRLGRVQFQQKDSDKKYLQDAYDTFKSLYNIDPKKMTRYEINMARLYQQDGQTAQAKKLIQLALDRDGDNLATQLAAAQWAIETDDLDMAKKAAAKALELDPDSMEARFAEGLIGRVTEDYPAAEAAFREAQKIKPSNAVVLNQLAISLASQDDREKQEKAFEFAQMGTRLFAQRNVLISRECAVTLAWVMDRLGKKEAAMKQLQAALQAGPVGPDASYFAAYVLHDNGRSDAALKLLQNAIESGTGVFPSEKQADELIKTIRGN